MSDPGIRTSPGGKMSPADELEACKRLVPVLRRADRGALRVLLLDALNERLRRMTARGYDGAPGAGLTVGEWLEGIELRRQVIGLLYAPVP